MQAPVRAMLETYSALLPRKDALAVEKNPRSVINAKGLDISLEIARLVGTTG